MADNKTLLKALLDNPLLRSSGQAGLERSGKRPARCCARHERRLMDDEYARKIFDLWFSGRAPAEVVFDNARWGAYMQARPEPDGAPQRLRQFPNR